MISNSLQPDAVAEWPDTTPERPAQHYAISEYPDCDQIYARLKALIRQPIRPIRRDRMQAVLEYFDAKCARSKALTDEAKRFIPGGVQHNLAFNYPFPIATASISADTLLKQTGGT